MTCKDCSEWIQKDGRMCPKCRAEAIRDFDFIMNAPGPDESQRSPELGAEDANETGDEE